MSQLLWPILFVLATPYVLGPIVTWLTFRLRAYSTYNVIEPTTLPANVQRYLASVAPELVQEGFVAACYVHNVGMTAGVQAYIAAWINRERGQMASVMAVLPAVGTTKFTFSFSTTSMPNGRTVTTSNYGADAGVFEQREWLDSVRVPWVTSPRELYHVHLYRERRLIPADAVRYVPTLEAAAASITEIAAHEILEQVRAGLLRETTRAGEVRATPYGALMVTIRLLPPLKQIRLWQSRRRARRDYEQAKASPAPPPPPPLAPSVTHESPFVKPAGRFPLNYA